MAISSSALLPPFLQMARNIAGLTAGAVLRKCSHSRSLPRVHKAYLSGLSSPEEYIAGVKFWPAYLQPKEQRILLQASLHKLDNSESIRSRKKRRAYLKSLPSKAQESDSVQSCFLPDDYYEFQDGHYDGVIHGYREMHLTSWPVEEFEGLSNVIKRLRTLCPSQNIQTHLLHLATRGYILPHIDNVDSSGNWILGVSLGNERLLRLDPDGDAPSLQLSLPSGSVYIQSGDVRYTYKHSIIQKAEGGQRLSVLIRVNPLYLGISQASAQNYIGFSDGPINVALECNDEKSGQKIVVDKEWRQIPSLPSGWSHRLWQFFGGASGSLPWPTHSIYGLGNLPSASDLPLRSSTHL